MSIIDEIRAREQATTPGPWKDWGAYNLTGNPHLAVKNIDKIVVQLGMSGPVICYIDPFRIREGKAVLNKEDAEFIAHSRADIPYLLSEVDRLTAELDEYKILAYTPEQIVALESENARLKAERDSCRRVKDYWDGLYGKGLKIANWHLNGETEPFDNFWESAENEYHETETEHD